MPRRFAARARTTDPQGVARVLQSKLDQLGLEAAQLTRKPTQPAAPVQYGKRAGDHIAETQEQTTRSVAADQLERLSSEVREALAKVEAGSYGRCDDCGRQIPEERLEALPWARRCIDCQSRQRG